MTESTTDMFSEQAWEERYRSRGALWSGRSNPELVTEVSDLSPGTALDAGSGEGGDALWLAGQGWQVTALDFATIALERGAVRAAELGAEIAGRIRWEHADLTAWSPGEVRFDLVCSLFLHPPGGAREDVFARLAAAVAPGGTLLVVGHHPSDLQTTMPRPNLPEVFFTAEDVARSLDEGQWEIITAEARPHSATDPEGREVTVHDAILRARKRVPAR
jgi:2-polyprenyl-3-methyl-5-hydroxy-6-metoxy-1,4-benzoquinol methylase